MGYDFFKGIGLGPVDLKNKKDRVSFYVRKLLNLCSSMLEFDGLPESIPLRDIRRLLQVHGYAIGPDPKLTGGIPYMFFGGLGGPPDVYYNPTIATVASPALEWSAELRIHKDAVLIRHDAWVEGLLPMLRSYATFAVETELSLYVALINSRIPSLISANDTRTFQSATEFIKEIERGNVGVISETKLIDAIRSTPYAQTGTGRPFTDLIELAQYQKATLYNDLGVNANYNMKRESLAMDEAQMNDDALLPYVDGVIQSIQTGLDEYREKFGIDIRVKKGSAWKYREIEEQAQHDENADPEEGGSDDVDKTS